MKIRLVTAFTLLLLFTGCAQDTIGVSQPAGTMKATVNGTAWSSAYVPGITGGTIAVHNAASGTLTITGTSLDLSGNTQTIGLVLLHQGIGTDTLGLGSTGTWSTGIPSQDSYVTAGYNSGIVSISQYDATAKTISGTFSFTARQASNPANTVTVTNGSFTTVKWTEQ